MRDQPRRLLALICAYSDRDDAAGALRAALPLAGRTLVERQALAAAAAGAEAILLLSDPEDRSVAAAIDRLRSDAVPVAVARTADDAARMVDAADRLLLVADGAIGEEEEIARLLEGEGFALLTLPDEGVDERFERIDADARWAGFAMLDGRALRDTAPMLGDWDLQSTLLRRAVQQGARKIRVDADAAPVIALVLADVAALENDLLRGAAKFQHDWVSRYLLSPLEGEATRRLLAKGASPLHLWGTSAALALLAAFACLFGWHWAGLILFLLSTPMVGIGERLARLAGADRLARRVRQGLPFTAAFALCALGYGCSAIDGWGAGVLAAAAVAFAAALEGERPHRSGTGVFLAEFKGMAWALLPFAAIGHWTLGLAALATYAGGSFFIAQRRAHGRGRVISPPLTSTPL